MIMPREIECENQRHLIEELAEDIGFDLVSWCDPVLPEIEAERLRFWLASGYHGDMRYLAKNTAPRCDLRSIDERCRSALVLGLEYGRGVDISDMETANGKGWVSFYAWGEDYHRVIDEMTGQLAARLDSARPANPFLRRYVDTGPPMEKAYGVQAGLGWLGKNCCLIHPRKGSYFFLAIVLTTLPPPSPSAPEFDHCGSCRRCLDICPTDAFPEPYVLDSRRCISYLTIELKGEIPNQFRSRMSGHIFGCDLCQMVCPWNQRFAAVSSRFDAGGQSCRNVDLKAWSMLEPEEFSRTFRHSAIKRTKRRGLLRNITVAMAASGDSRFIPYLEPLCTDREPLVAIHARWALQQLEG